MSNLKNISDNELLQMYANADATCSCGGHYKGHRNEVLRAEYAEELLTRGVVVKKSVFDKVVPNVKIPEGVFNGPGSY